MSFAAAPPRLTTTFEDVEDVEEQERDHDREHDDDEPFAVPYLVEEPQSFKRRRREEPRYSLFSSSSVGHGGVGGSGRGSTDHGHNLLRERHSSSLDLPDLPGDYDDDGSSSSLSAGGGGGGIGGTADHALTTRRIYDDLTAIDWIFEYTRERSRLRALHSGTGVFGHFARVFDASQIWLVLIGTGIAAGLVAAAIDIVANWLGGLKEGYCTSSFYLSKEFCCWGLEERDGEEACKDWAWWSQAVGVRGGGGKYAVEYLLYIGFSIVFATSASLLVKNFAPYARHSGIPEIKTLLGGFVIRRFLGGWTLAIKSIGLCLAESSGLWLGKEGPLVHVACCCANIMMKPFGALRKNEARKREVLSAAAAAGISVAFGSPIGGVLFSLEQLSYYFPDKTMWQSFVCAMVAAVTLQFMNPFRTGKLVLYQVKYTRGWHDFEMIPFALLGILGGLYGAFFIKLNMKVAAWRKNSIVKKFPVTEVLVVTVVTALVNYPIVFMRPQSSELVANLFQECSPQGEDFFGLCHHTHSKPIVLLLLSSILGALLASATFGLQIPAGIILPSMAIGALYGRAMGLVVQSWQHTYPNAWFFASCEPDIECVTPGTFAIIGAASALGGVTRMTVSIVVITFELTGALTYVLPIMVAVMISKWVGDAFGKRGIYESWIRFKDYPFLDNRDDPVPDVPVVEIMTRIEDLVVITETGHTVGSLVDILRSQPYKGFPVVSDVRDASLVGYISRSELRFALDQARHVRGLPESAECIFSGAATAGADAGACGRTVDMRPWMDQTPITLPSSSSLSLAANLFQKLGLRYVLFANHGALQGLLTKKDVFFVMNSSEEGVSGMRGGRLETRSGGGGEGRRLLADDGSEVTSLEEELEAGAGRGNLLGSM